MPAASARLGRILALLGGVAASSVQAQEQGVDELARLDLESLLNIEVSAATTQAQTVREAPSTVSVITEEQIGDYGWLSLNEVLYRQPGFSPSRDYDRRTVSARGLFEGWNNNHLLLLVDGLPFNEPLYGSALTSEITPLVLVQSVEVIRGPGSALYGSSATNGVVSVHTPEARSIPQRGKARLRYGSQNHWIADALAGADSEHVGLVVAFNSFATDGYDVRSPDGSGRTRAGDLARFRIRDDRNSTYLFLKLSAHEALEGLELSFHRQDWSFQTGHGWLWSVPDHRESMSESRTVTTLSYRHDSPRLSQLYALSHQRHAIDWNMRFFPDDATAFWGTTYPTGAWEHLDTNGDSVLAKIQETLHLPEAASLLLGLDGSLFIYNGDRSHTSNAQLSGDYSPVPGGGTVKLRPWLEWIDDHPMQNTGAYLQFVSGELLGHWLEATLGARYDRLDVRYTAIDLPDRPERKRTFQQVSPRLGLVFDVSDALALKLLAARAFRAPAATELAGSNTLSLASNIRSLKPEVISSLELGSEWRAIEELALRVTAFYTRFDDQIAYSTQGANLSTNLYSLTTVGGECEALVDVGPIDGFANYSYARRVDEDIADPGVSASPRATTWVPAHVANLGVVGRILQLTGSLQLHVQGSTRRRKGDNASDTNRAERGRDVAGWLGLDARLAYAPLHWLELDVMINNALDGLLGNDTKLAKNFDYPFDYQADGRRITGSLAVRY